MSFAHHPENINRKGRPKGSSKTSQLRDAIHERIDIGQLFYAATLNNRGSN